MAKTVNGWTGNPRITIRFKEDDIKKIDLCAEKSSLSRAEYARSAILKKVEKDIKKGK